MNMDTSWITEAAIVKLYLNISNSILNLAQSWPFRVIMNFSQKMSNFIFPNYIKQPDTLTFTS